MEGVPVWFRAGSAMATLAAKPRRRISIFMSINEKGGGMDGGDNEAMARGRNKLTAKERRGMMCVA